MGKPRILLRTVFHEILHPYPHIFSPHTFSEHLGFMFEPLLKSHSGSFKYDPLKNLIGLPGEMSDVHLRKRFGNLHRLFVYGRNLGFS